VRYIEFWYNSRRRHSGLQYRAPQQARNEITWNGSPQRELTTNPLSGKFGADHNTPPGALRGHTPRGITAPPSRHTAPPRGPLPRLTAYPATPHSEHANRPGAAPQQRHALDERGSRAQGSPGQPGQQIRHMPRTSRPRRSHLHAVTSTTSSTFPARARPRRGAGWLHRGPVSHRQRTSYEPCHTVPWLPSLCGSSEQAAGPGAALRPCAGLGLAATSRLCSAPSGAK